VSVTSILVFVFLPIAAAALTPVLAKIREGLADVLAIAVAAGLLVLGITYIGQVRDYGSISFQLPGTLPFAQTLYLDSLSLLVLLVISTVALLALIYSVQYMKQYGSKPRYYALFLLMVAGMNGVVLSHDLFGLYVFLEVAACSSYALVAFGLRKPGLEAAFKYLLLSSAASALLLLGIGLVYSQTGSLDFKTVSNMLAAGYAGGNRGLLFISTLFLVTFCFKMAIVPFHAWLPDAYPAAPTPVSATMAGVLSKTAGVYVMARIFYNVIGIQSLPRVGQAMMALGVLSIVIGSILGLVQTEYKRLLAYSSVAQLGYIVLALGIGTPLAFVGALYHVMNHATSKSLLFLTAGAAQRATGTRDLNQMGGLGKRMPLTATCSVFGSMAISGVPPFNGFFSKAIIVIAALSAGMATGSAIYFVYALIAVLMSLLTLAYFLKLQRKAFFGLLKDEFAKVKEVGLSMALPMVVLALLCLGLGISFPWLYTSLLRPAGTVLTSLLVR
jgi:multicomponent Na+:H+ antiporter subunit D